MFEDAKGVEDNIRASRRVQDPVYFEDMHGKEQEDSKYGSDPKQQQGCKYTSELDQSSSALTDDSMDRYAYQFYDQFSNHVEYTVTNDGLDN